MIQEFLLSVIELSRKILPHFWVKFYLLHSIELFHMSLLRIAINETKSFIQITYAWKTSKRGEGRKGGILNVS